ncbi:MAG TPA: sigma factor-like helix-turn-helix DNA-binding protein, partial [Gemmataceae bacterium]
FRYSDVLAVDPPGVEPPVLGTGEAAPAPARALGGHRGEEDEDMRARQPISDEEAMEALRLHREEGLTYAQIADRFGVGYNRVNAMITKARRIERDQSISTAVTEATATDKPAPFDPGAVQEEMDVGLAEAAARSGLTAELDARLDAAIERAARVLVQATSRIPDEMQQTLDRTRAQVATLEQEVALLRDELRALRAEFADHTHLPDGRPVIVRPIAAGVAWPVEGEEADTA